MLKMIVTLNILSVITVGATGINYHIVHASSVQAPTSIGLVQLNHGPFGFDVFNNQGRLVAVPVHQTDEALRKLTTPELAQHLENHYITATQASDGSYCLRSQPRLTGGGPWTGKIMYYLTKATIAAVAFSAAKKAALAVAGKSFVSNGIILLAEKRAVSPGVGIIMNGIKTMGAEKMATETTVAVVQSAGTVSRAFTWMESCALAVGGFFAVQPWCP